jgi:soluble lytic murein transglycosylase
MSTSASTRARPLPPARRRRAAVRRRVLWLLAAALAGGILVAAVVAPRVDKAVQEIALPLRHDDIIRQQAADKGLDPALIAGVIYTESRFRDQTSHAGAKGLMQILPSTADYIARKSGGTAFVHGDLADPQLNIAYGSFYLRYLIRRYGGNETLAIAAYNAGEGRIDRWIFEARRQGEEFDHARHIPFAETRDYVARVLDARRRYREQYPKELGL